MLKQKRIYLAGPFFNPIQLKLIQLLEALLKQNGFEVFSPRLSSPSLKAKSTGMTDALAAESYTLNVAEIRACDMVFAVLDFLLDNEFLAICGCEPGREPGDQRQDPVCIPDTGVVWEMGLAVALGKPIFGYYQRMGEGQVPNLMLAQCCAGLVIGHAQLLEFVAVLAGWKGKQL